MLIKGSTQLWDKDGDGAVDITDLTLALDELDRITQEVRGIAKYITGKGELPNPVDVTVDVKIGG
jgi:Ca2+-binding EF-hand superfamily protein